MRKLYGAEQHRIERIEQGKRSATDFIVIHDMESDNIDGVQRYFETSSPDEVGAHIGICKHGEIRQWADLDALVYHARGANDRSPGIELCGFAKQGKLVWLRRVRQRRALAKTIARLCHAYGLGFPGHHNVKGHFEIQAGGHTDPGANFPWDRVLKLARAYYRRFYR